MSVCEAFRFRGLVAGPFVLFPILFLGSRKLSSAAVETLPSWVVDQWQKPLLQSTRRRSTRIRMRGGSIVTLTYLGSERVFPNYNVMGVAKAALEASVRYLAHNLGSHNIRVNAISAGPIKTLAAKGIRGFSEMHRGAAAASPLKRDTEVSGLGDLSLLLTSDLGRGVTGQVIYLDSGYHIMGMTERGRTAASELAS